MESEARTRKSRIDVALRDAGWEMLPFDAALNLASLAHHAIEEYATANGPADYALVANGDLIGVVEAKKLSLGPQNVLVQASRYAQGVTTGQYNFRGYRVPFLFSTNGEVIWFHDVRHPQEVSRRITRFPTPEALTERLTRDFAADCEKLLAMPNEHPRLRPYQIEANAATEAAIAAHKRQMLVAMATGTGKTFTTVNQVYRLMKSGVAKRVLFLVDRKALAAQAVRAFASFEPEPGLKFDKVYEVYSQRFRREDFDEEEKFDPKILPPSYLLTPNAGMAFVYVCTIQRMAINLFGHAASFGGEEEDDDEADKLDIPIHAFDCIIADECHRGYTSSELSVWRGTLDHFDAIKIGLTATPAAHTKAYFNEVVYRYEYERAVREGFLVDYDAVTIKSNIRLDGLFLKAGEQVRLIDPKSGAQQLDLLEDERQFDTTEIERKVTAPESNRKIIEEIKRYALDHEQRYGRFPKTLIFAVNDISHTSHADQLVELCREVFGRGESFVQKITGSPTVDRPLQRIREFRNRPNPAIVVTVDMLSTGVDIPDLEFIVFLRPVKSRILFEQMLGRGTRKGDKYKDKSHFTVFDCFDGSLLEYFRTASAFTREPPEKPSRTFEQIIDDIWQNRDREYNVRCLTRRLQRIDKEMSGDAREMFAAFMPDGDVAKFAAGLQEKLQTDFTGTMKTLRNESFQDLLVNYPRPPHRFIIAPEAQDDVTSQWLIRDGSGQEYKPQDYLAAFAQYVRDNPDHIEAVQILLDRPRDWSTDALSELRTKLKANRLRFSEENLQKAHEITYHKSLVDIISMVKRAAKDDAPLLTASERVDAALSKLTAGQTFTEEQHAWLERIRDHLISNLSIDASDFDDLPVFSREGGWGRANRVFENRLSDFLKQINEALAA
jgi:type I restriction enzyme R subunit